MFLFLTRLADNGIGDEGVRMLAEPLGKLTALRKLDLGGTVSAVFAFLIACGGAMYDGSVSSQSPFR